MTDLSQQIEAAEAHLLALRRQMKQASCVEFGHDWQSYGGCNAGCDLDKNCRCSVPVNVCGKCGDCDYGDNAEATKIRAECAMVAS